MKRLDTQVLLERFKSRGLFVVDELPLNTTHKVECQDSNGYKYLLCAKEIMDKRTKNPSKFDAYNPFTIHNIHNYIKENKISTILLSETYESLNDHKLNFKCGICGNTYMVSLNHFVYSTCHICGKCAHTNSRLVRATENWLKENDVDFIKEYSFEDCRNIHKLKFDYAVFINNEIILIEVDGEFHYKVTHKTTQESLEYQQKRDRIKDKYCKDKGIRLIRIPFWDFKNEEYINKLNQIFLSRK